jgi:deoxycytidylate deaminase
LPSYFALARVASQHSTERYRVGAVIVSPKPISIGFNCSKSHPKFSDGIRTYSLHAEVSAILKARTDLSGGIIYVYREDRLGNVALAKPCDTCMEVILETGLKRIYYTTPTEPFFESIDL